MISFSKAMGFYIIYVPSRVACPIIKQVITASAALSTAGDFCGEEIVNGHNNTLSKKPWRNNYNSLIPGRHKHPV